jgi:hypothetical protein
MRDVSISHEVVSARNCGGCESHVGGYEGAERVSESQKPLIF